MPKETLIVPGSTRNEVMKSFLNDDKPLFGLEVLSLNAYKSSLVYKELDSKEEKTRLFSIIRDHIRPDNIYRDELKYPAFFSFFYDFANLLVRNNVGADCLPDDDPDPLRKKEYQDKKEILSFLLEQNLSSQEIRKAFADLEDVGNVTIYDYFYPELSDRKDIDSLLERKARFEIKVQKKDTVFYSYTTNNNIREVIAVAQMLVREKKNTDLNRYVLMLNNENAYLPIIERVFTYYRIPFAYTKKIRSVEAVRFLSLLKFIRRQDSTSFVSAYNHNVFSQAEYVLTEYINRYSITYEQLFKPLDNAEKLKADPKNKEYYENTFRYTMDKLIATEKECEAIMSKIRKIIGSDEFVALKNDSLRRQCDYAYEMLYGKIGKTDITYSKLNEIQDLHDLIEVIVRQDYDDENLFKVLEYELNNQKVQQKIEYKGEDENNILQISDPYQNPIGKSVAIILGCTQQNYPKSIANNGFFDEDYIEKVKGFPTLVERNEYFEKEYRRFLMQFDQVYFSYPAASINGDKYERSALISDYDVEKDKDGRVVDRIWKYSEMNVSNDPEEVISMETAEKIYLKNGKLKGSPSAMQSYVSCPFKYFLERGLQIEDEEPLAVGSDVIGTLQHRVMERFFDGEVDLKEEELPVIFQPYFDFMKKVLPNEADKIEAMKQRLAWSFGRSAKFMREFKAADEKNFTYKTEEKINFGIENNGYEIYINNGSVDRLDLNEKEGRYRIIDYKSSSKKIKMSDVRKGINFQLLVYMIFYFEQYLQEQQKELSPDLVAYFSMKNSTLKPSGAEQLKSDQQLREEEVEYSTYLCEEDEADERFFNVQKEELSFAELHELIPQLYRAIADLIMSGRIAIEATQITCQFCRYADICHRIKDDCIDESEMKELV